MRLLLMNEKLSYAGNSSYTQDLALALVAAGHEVKICTTGGSLREVFARQGIETFVVKYNLLSYRKLLEFLKEYSPDLIHVQNRLSARFGQRISAKLGVPHILTVHRLPDSLHPRIMHRLLVGVIAVNEVIRESLVNNHGVPKSLIRVIPRGVDVQSLAPVGGWKPPPPGVTILPVIGSVGSLTPIKGHDVFLRAARLVLDQGLEAMFAIVGEGPEGPKLRTLAKDLSLVKYLTFSPHVPSRQELYRVFDIVVVPTLRGGLGSTALEAMAMGKPVIASAVGEILHILQDGRTGLLVPQGDPDALAEGMVRLLESPALRESLGQAARAHVEQNLPLAPMVQATESLYEEICAQSPEPGAVSVN